MNGARGGSSTGSAGIGREAGTGPGAGAGEGSGRRTRRGIVRLAGAAGAARAAGAAGVAGALVGACAPESGAPPAARAWRRRSASPPWGTPPSARCGSRSPAPTTRWAGITVQYEPCTAGTGAQDCLPVYFAQFVAGSPPDVWRVDDEPLPFYADKSIYMELDRLFARDSREINPADFFPRTLAAFRYDRQAFRFGQGKLYALPFNTGGDMLFCQQAALHRGRGAPAAPGRQLDDRRLAGAGPRMTVLEGGGAMRTAALAGRPSFRGDLSWLWARGAKLLDESGRAVDLHRPRDGARLRVAGRPPAPPQGRPRPQRPPGPGQPLLRRPRGDVRSASPTSVRELYARPQLDWDVAPFPKALDGQRYTRETADGVGLPGGVEAGGAGLDVRQVAGLGGGGEDLQPAPGGPSPPGARAANSPEYLRPDTPQHEETDRQGPGVLPPAAGDLDVQRRRA